jgi:hypothetical protein
MVEMHSGTGRGEAMADSGFDQFFRDHGEDIVAGASARLGGDATVGALAGQRDLGEDQLLTQVFGFWLEGIRSDLSLGSAVALEHDLTWLSRLREGHQLLFDDGMVLRMFTALSEEIERRLTSSAQRREYEAYRARVTGLIGAAFPGAALP